MRTSAACRVNGITGKLVRSANLTSAALEYASECYLPTSWTALKLLSRIEHNHDTTMYEFALPEGQSLNLPVCACLLLRAPGRGRKEGTMEFDPNADAVRPYTPVSDNSMTGKFQLLVKRYDGGAVSGYLHQLAVGSDVDFRHIAFNIKEQYPFEGKKRITMLAGGTGIAPMYQALLKLMHTSGDDREVRLVLGNKTREDILLRNELETWASESSSRFKLVYVVGDKPNEPTDMTWTSTDQYTATMGWIDRAKVEKYCHPPADDTLVMVCGVPALYEALCGPRQTKELADGSILQQLGYSAHMVAKM